MSPYIIALINLRLHPMWQYQAILKLAKPAAEVSTEGPSPKLRSAAAFPL
jgi:predicted ATP-binding protein involved in virulence